MRPQGGSTVDFKIETTVTTRDSENENMSRSKKVEETKEGIFQTWGTESYFTENSSYPVTIGVVVEKETGVVYKVSPDKIKFLTMEESVMRYTGLDLKEVFPETKTN